MTQTNDDTTITSNPYSDDELIKNLPVFSNQYATVNGVRLHYVEGGAGEPLVCLPAWPQTWHSYHHVATEFAKFTNQLLLTISTTIFIIIPSILGVVVKYVLALGFSNNLKEHLEDCFGLKELQLPIQTPAPACRLLRKTSFQVFFYANMQSASTVLFSLNRVKYDTLNVESAIIENEKPGLVQLKQMCSPLTTITIYNLFYKDEKSANRRKYSGIDLPDYFKHDIGKI